MNLKYFVKRVLFWPYIRKWMIIRHHQKVAVFCRMLIDDYNKKAKDISLSSAKKNLYGKKIIWQYWGLGYNHPDMPELVRICLDSVEKYCKGEEYLLIRLTDENISEYIDLPEYVFSKKTCFPAAIFADLLRVCLLTVYGGCWLDATVLLTGRIPERYWSYDFFMYRRDEEEKNKKYWENSYAYYYGWNSGYKVRILNSIFFAKEGCAVVREFCNILLWFWQTHTELPDYFMFQILFNELVSSKYENLNCPLESDCLPHYIQQIINDDKFDIATFDETLKLTNIHKLSYKSKDCAVRLSALLERHNLLV